MIYDYIIIGTGISGLNAARLIPKNKKVLILCKKSPWECNTFYAQGGIASAVDDLDIKEHITDTLNAGANYNNKKAVKILSENSLSCIQELIQEGLKFDLNNENQLAFTKEAAHSKSRILHADGDATGRMMHLFLLKSVKHTIKTHVVVNDLLIQKDICYGVQYFTNEQEQELAYSHNTIIASGGVGSIYKYHTNSPTIAGEIQGICLEKGIILKDMEMMQFHPTVLKGTHFARKPLLSEALRGEGAFIVDEQNHRFLFDYHKDGELAPRDIVCRAMFDHQQKTQSNIYLSLENFNEDFLKKRFPNIYGNLKDLGFDLPYDKIPISPAYHYAMGGIMTNLDTRVPNMQNLYAIGESACVGIHGANRLASNSLLEGLVFSKISVEYALRKNYKISQIKYKQKIKSYIRNNQIDKTIKNDLRKIMWHCASVVRNEEDIVNSLKKLNNFLQKDVGRLLFLRLLTAKSILQSALKRKSSLGAHYIKENK